MHLAATTYLSSDYWMMSRLNLVDQSILIAGAPISLKPATFLDQLRLSRLLGSLAQMH